MRDERLRSSREVLRAPPGSQNAGTAHSRGVLIRDETARSRGPGARFARGSEAAAGCNRSFSASFGRLHSRL